MRLLALTLVLSLVPGASFVAGVFAAPTPKEKPETKETNKLEEPVEPTIELALLTKDPISRVRDAANRTKSANNMKQIGLAFHNYCDVNGSFPTGTMTKDGKPGLSWRVLLLPYIEEEQLFKKFNLDEPWDSPNNIKLLEQMPKIYESPRVTCKKKGFTVYQGFGGEDALFNPGVKRTFANIPDGTSNTIMTFENSVAVPWTAPMNVEIDPKKDLPDFGKAYGGRIQVGMCDGSVRLIDLKKVKPETFKAAITTSGGEVLGSDW